MCSVSTRIDQLLSSRERLAEDTLRPFGNQISSARFRRYVGGDPGGLCVSEETTLEAEIGSEGTDVNEGYEV